MFPFVFSPQLFSNYLVFPTLLSLFYFAFHFRLYFSISFRFSHVFPPSRHMPATDCLIFVSFHYIVSVLLFFKYFLISSSNIPPFFSFCTRLNSLNLYASFNIFHNSLIFFSPYFISWYFHFLFFLSSSLSLVPLIFYFTFPFRFRLNITFPISFNIPPLHFFQLVWTFNIHFYFSLFTSLLYTFVTFCLFVFFLLSSLFPLFSY